MNVNPNNPNCPECNSENVARIVFGYPSPELMHESQRGEVVLGGCGVSSDDPAWHCNDCGHGW